jgi:hypothetical protein
MQLQSLDQPDHRQRIPVTVVEQVSPDSVSVVLRNLTHDEEEPGDCDASFSGLRSTRSSAVFRRIVKGSVRRCLRLRHWS